MAIFCGTLQIEFETLVPAFPSLPKLHLNLLASVQQYIRYAQIKSLYEDGPENPAAHPLKHRPGEIMRRTKSDMMSNMTFTPEDLVELKVGLETVMLWSLKQMNVDFVQEDILQKRWRDALLGRRKLQWNGRMSSAWETRPMGINVRIPTG